MIKVNARATFSQEGPFKLTTIERRDLQPHDVLIEIKYAGICHSDIHTARGNGDRSTIHSFRGMRSPELSARLVLKSQSTQWATG